MLKFSRRKKHETQDDQQQPAVRFKGSFDDLNGMTLHGWAFDRDSSDPASVVVVCDQEILGITRADLPRPDVSASGEGPLSSGFAYHIAASFEGSYEKLGVFVVGKEVAEAVSRACTLRDRTIDAPVITVDGIHDFQKAGETRILSKTSSATETVDNKINSRKISSLFASNAEGGVCLIEIQDLLSFLRVHNNVTGIQRTVCGLIDALLKNKSQYQRFHFCAVSSRVGYVMIFDTEEVYKIIMTVVAGNAVQQRLFNAIENLFSKSIEYRTRERDNFIISGAYWILQDFGSKLYNIKKNGTTVGAYIYDIIPITTPQWVTASTNREVLESAFDVFALSDYFLTISNFVKEDLDRLLQVEFRAGKSITAVPLPHILPFRKVTDTEKVPSRIPGQALHASYVLCVCTIEGRKNHMLLARIWTALIRRHGFANVPRLVLVGKWGWRIEEFREFCETTHYLDGKISPAFGVSDDTLETLYKNCLLTIFPSFVEGWGLPVGESLALGKLCLASNASSIPEVGGDFVDYFDPNDFFSALKVVERALYADGYLEERTRNIVENFLPRTWETLAETFMAGIATSVERVRANRSASLPLQPLVEAGRAYLFADLAANQMIAWDDKRVRFALASGWHTMEQWGAWSSRPRATVSFVTEAAQGDALTVLLRLTLPSPYRQEALVVQSGGETIADLSGFNPDESPKWMQVEATAGPNGLVTLDLCRPIAFAKDEGHRQLHIGISGLAIYPTNDSVAELSIMKSMLKTAGVAVS